MDADYRLSFTASSPYDLSASSAVTSLSTPLSGTLGHYRHAGCTIPPTGKFAYVAYSPVTSPRDADVTCPDGDVMTCSCVSAPDGGGDVTSALPISGPTCLDVGDQLRQNVEFV